MVHNLKCLPFTITTGKRSLLIQNGAPENELEGSVTREFNIIPLFG